MAVRIELPATADAVRKLKVGDEIEIYGRMLTARDMGHKYMVENAAEWLETYLKGCMVYHCGPVMAKKGDKWRAVSAGPTTSIREEPYQAQVIKKYGLRGVIGKGGMGKNTLEACREHGCAYFHAIGGAAVALASSIVDVEDVFMLEEFGIPEAFWVMRVEGFKTVVTMDSQGRSLHDRVSRASEGVLKKLVA